MLKRIFEHNIVTIPWPVYVDARFFEGSKVTKSESCDNACVKELTENGSHRCQHGLSHISKIIDGTRLVVSSVYLHSSTNTLKQNKKYKNKKACASQIHNWMLDVEQKYQSINDISTHVAKTKFDQFHEFAKWANEINFYSNRLVDKSKNKENVGFNAANEDLKSLYKTSVMLLDSLDTSSIYFNPQSASFGNKRAADIYSMIHKIALVLSHSKINKSRVNIPIKGHVENKHRVYESFKIIPLSFIQNALKYRRANDVEIHFSEVEKDLTLSVISYGDLILENELLKLFDRGYRASSALNRKLEGNGLGLYVAKIVADAHSFKLTAESSMSDENKKIAKNIFTVSIR